MSKLRRSKGGSKSQGKTNSSLRIDELFTAQVEKQTLRSPSNSNLDTSPYFSPEKKKSFSETSRDGESSRDSASGRRLSKLSRRYKTCMVQETEKLNEKKRTSEIEKHVDITVVSKRKVHSSNHHGYVPPGEEEAKKPKLTLFGNNESSDNFTCISKTEGDSAKVEDKANNDERGKGDAAEMDTLRHTWVTKTDSVLLDCEADGVSIVENESESISTAVECTDVEKKLTNDRACSSSEDGESVSKVLVSNTKRGLPSAKVSKAQSSEEKGENEEEDVAEEEEDSTDFRIPYYLENFQVILKTVLEDEFYIPLFDEADLKTVEKFNNLTDNGQKLYVRLFQRKYRWVRKEKISYPRIAEDLTEIFEELVKWGFILDESKMEALEEVLAALPALELKQLAKSLRLNTSQQMSDLVQAILKHSRQTNISSFFTMKNKGGGGTTAMILNRAKNLLGSCYKLSCAERDVFIRAVMLFSLHQIDGDMDEASGGQSQLFQMLMTNIGRMVYPSYTVNKQTRIFLGRNDVIRFQKAVIMEDDIFEAMDKHHFNEAMVLYKSCYAEWKSIWENESISRHDRSLAEHLRMYTAGSVYARVLTYGVEVLQKKRLYKEAVVLLEELLGQKVYQPSYRGRWYDRLALNLDQHLKQHSKALDVIKKALADDAVRFGHRYALFQRAQRICNSPSKKKLKSRWKEFMDDVFITVMEAPTVTIEGKLLTKNTQFAVYVTDEHSDLENEKTLSKRVEDVALAYYRENGYPEGIHGEGSSFVFLLVLLMWNVFYDCDVPDTFLNPYQVFPLDLRTDHFYESRKSEIEQCLELIRTSSPEQLSEMLGESWSKHEGVLSVNWERYQSVEHAQGLVRCVGGPHLAAIFERMVKNMRFCCSGFADLVVWNPETLKFRISEVKGPGDRLSVKQILWLDYLVNFGIQAETCYVKAVGCKRLQTT